MRQQEENVRDDCLGANTLCLPCMSLAAEAQQRYAHHYLDVLRQLGNLYQDRRATSNLFFQLDADWPQIATAQRWAARHDSVAARKYCSDCARCAATLLSLRQTASERIDWLKTALGGAIDLGDRVAQAQHLGNLGIAYEDLGHYDESYRYLAAALQIDAELQDERMEQVHAGQLGLALIGLARYAEAITSLNRGPSIAQKLGDRAAEAIHLGNLALALEEIGELDLAERTHESALATSREIGDRRGEGRDIGNLGVVYYQTGRYEAAERYFLDALKISREVGHRYEKPWTSAT